MESGPVWHVAWPPSAPSLVQDHPLQVRLPGAGLPCACIFWGLMLLIKCLDEDFITTTLFYFLSLNFWMHFTNNFFSSCCLFASLKSFTKKHSVFTNNPPPPDMVDFGCIFSLVKTIGFCPSLPADALMNLGAMRSAGGWWLVDVWGPQLELSNGGNHRAPRAIWRWVKEWKVAQKMMICSTKHDDLLGGRDLVVVLMCMFRVEL